MNRKCFTLLVIILLSFTFTNLAFGQNVKTQNTQNKSSSRELSQATKDSLKVLTTKETKHLALFLNRIADKGKKLDLRLGLIKEALTLFLNNGDKTSVEVSSGNEKASKIYKTKEYFYNLATLNYASVEIKFANFYFVSDFKLRPDGKYEGVVSIQQTFIGHPKSDEFKPYTDVTKKNITVIVERNTVFTGTKEKIYDWKLFFGDIKVSQTK